MKRPTTLTFAAVGIAALLALATIGAALAQAQPGAGPGGMMGGRSFTGTGPMPVTSQQARATAQRWLDAYQPGVGARSPDPFYGYYTVDFEKGGNMTGMLSVNGYSGAIWYHSWHGSFVRARDLGA